MIDEPRQTTLDRINPIDETHLPVSQFDANRIITHAPLGVARVVLDEIEELALVVANIRVLRQPRTREETVTLALARQHSERQAAEQALAAQPTRGREENGGAGGLGLGVGAGLCLAVGDRARHQERQRDQPGARSGNREDPRWRVDCGAGAGEESAWEGAGEERREGGEGARVCQRRRQLEWHRHQREQRREENGHHRDDVNEGNLIGVSQSRILGTVCGRGLVGIQHALVCLLMDGYTRLYRLSGHTPEGHFARLFLTLRLAPGGRGFKSPLSIS